MNRSEWTAGDDNVVRLLGQPYDPPPVPAEFARRVQARLLIVAAEMARQRPSATPHWRARNRLPALAGVAALLGILVLGLHFLPRPIVPSPSAPLSANGRRLAAAPIAAAPRTATLAPGERISTRRGERRRLALSDGSVLSLNENTRVRHEAARHLALDAGEIFVEVAPRLADKAAALFTVATPHREVRALGTRFLVRAEAEGTGVAVTQGHVQVSDGPGSGLLSAGQQLTVGADAVTPAPRLSYLLDWTRDLVTAAAPPLVPPSSHAGGALVILDPQGHAANLSLRRYHIDVHIEDGFARTTIDQTYFNHTFGRLEGTFFFPLPADASLSRLAMYVNGELMEGGMLERDYGRIVFDQIVTKMKDPALLEWVDGHTFKMRVFPLEPRQEKRILLSYTQRLPSLYGRWSYRFPAGHSLGAVRDWSFHARVKDGKSMGWHCASHTLTPRIEQGDLLLDTSAHQAAMDRDLALDLTGSKMAESARFSTVTQEGHRYLMLRYRPQLPGSMKRQRRDWVFLFESSAERDPLLARTQVEIVRTLLANAEPDDTFAVLTIGTQVQTFAPSPQRTTPENVASAMAFLEKAHLLGALDLDAGLTAAAEPLNKSAHPVLVHLGCGQAILGERRAEVLVGRIPQQASYVGVGVGKRGASEFMRRAAERCQGYVTAINPDEAVAWRAFDLLATLNTPRLFEIRVADIEGKTPFLCPTSMVAQGEEVCAITRSPANAPLPSSVCVTGTLDGRPFREVVAVASPRPDAAYLPRTWARLEIDRLLAEDAIKNKNAIIALSKAMYVITPYTSLLVLENEAMYAQYKVDRGRKDHWAMYPCPPRIPVVSEWPPEPWEDPDYIIKLEVPPISRAAMSAESDAQLKERIRQANRGRAHLYAQGDIGIDSETPYKLNVDRVNEDVVVPGVVDPTQAVGIPDAPADAPRQNVPLPPGSGGHLPPQSIFYGEPLEHVPYPSLLSEARHSDESTVRDPEGEERFLNALLVLPAGAKQPTLWRQAAQVAERRKQHNHSLQYLCKMLEMERNRWPSLTALRHDNGWFLELAQQRVQELIARRYSVPGELLDQVMTIADEWRALEVEDWRPCWRAGRVLSLAGEHELAWSYLTSPSFLRQADARLWIELARQQHWQGEYGLAERAYAVAASLKPANAEILWERALNHRAAGRREEARRLLQQLDKGTWAEQYRVFQLRARRVLEVEFH